MTWEWVVLITVILTLGSSILDRIKPKEDQGLDKVLNLIEKVSLRQVEHHEKLLEHQKTLDEVKKFMSQQALASGLRPVR